MAESKINNKTFITKTYSYTASNWYGPSGVDISANMFKAVALEGYKPIGGYYVINNQNVSVSIFNPEAVGSELMLAGHNNGNTATVVFTITILYVPIESIKVL